MSNASENQTAEKTPTKPRFSLSRRWIKTRPGSVLILVIALLVLLALIGTAYLSSTQTERYTSVQNTVNTQADLLVDGLVLNVESRITNGVYGTGGSLFRPPASLNISTGSTYQAFTSTGYNTFTSPQTEDYLADRTPIISPVTMTTLFPYGFPTWGSISWSLFPDASSNYSFDSPFATSSQQPTPMNTLANKPYIQAIPSYLTINGQTYPAFLYYVAPGATISVGIPAAPLTAGSGGMYITAATNANTNTTYVQAGVGLVPDLGTVLSNPKAYPQYFTIAASASGDGIADSGLFKLPTGPIDGVTYYAAYRVIDNNSAVNVSTAWTAAVDPPISGLLDHTLSNAANNINYGFFRSNIGLRELLNDPNRTLAEFDEMDCLNYWRFNQSGTGLPLISSSPLFVQNKPPTPTIYKFPHADTGATRTDFTWFTIDGTALLAGDALDCQLARRPLNPYYNSATHIGSTNKFLYLDKAQSAALASGFSLIDPTASPSIIDQLLPYETTFNNYVSGTTTTPSYYPSIPYSPTQVGAPTQAGVPVAAGTWFGDLFDYHQFNNYYPTIPTNFTPIRTLLTASNPVSNGTPTRLGNASGSGPATWAQTNTYNFGDWVTYTDPSLTSNATNSFVCLQPILTTTGVDTSTTPVSTVPPTVNFTQAAGVTASQYWTQVPFSYQAVKTSINTGTFEQLWLGFCQVMTDSIAPAKTDVTTTSTVPQWQPPLIPQTGSFGSYGEEQMPQFRSVIRDNRHLPISNLNNSGQPGSSTSVPPVSPSTTYATRVQLTPMQMLQLRAAIAAINTESIRNIDSKVAGLTGGQGPGQNLDPAHPDVTVTQPATGSTHRTRSRRIILPDTAGHPAFEVEVFGNDIQPYINQVYAYMENLNDEANYIAIQLINPYPFDISMANWQFGSIVRNATTGTPGAQNLTLTGVATAPSTLTIPKATVVGGVLTPGYAIVYDGTPPSGIPPFPTGKSYEVPGLATAVGYELIILRPRAFSNTASTATNTYFDRFNEANIYDMVPVDQLDMTGASLLTDTRNLYYRRAAAPSVITPSFAWNFVWPGFYTPYNSGNVGYGPDGLNPAFGPRPNSTPLSTYKLNQAIIASATGPNSSNFDFSQLCSGTSDPALQSNSQPTYSTITLQLGNTSMPGVHAVLPSSKVGSTSNSFPFGGFARNVDMLQIPYIGAYRIANANASPDDPAATTHMFYEMNSVTMDASLANDSTLQASSIYTPPLGTPKLIPSTAGNTGVNPQQPADLVKDPFVEQIGHFCPIGDTNSAYTYSAGTPPDPTKQLDFGAAATNPATNWHYHWAKRLFDYFSVQTPNDDYLPNVDPDLEYKKYGTNVVAKYLPGQPIVPVPNTTANGATANTGEDVVGVEGLININTAPWPVLATLPFVPRSVASIPGSPLTDNIKYFNIQTSTQSTGDGIDDNVEIAKAIVDYRAVNGPFKSIFDLYNVPAFRLENDALIKSADPGIALGDFSPGGINPANAVTNGTDGARFDFEERFLLLNHISNLITTRSDTFTCYLDLQGWRNVGSGNPTLAVERRRAFIFDRNAYTPTLKNPIYFPVSTGH